MIRKSCTGRLDTNQGLCTLPNPPDGGYYGHREAHLTPRFTPLRADARTAHHLPGTEHGDGVLDSQLRDRVNSAPDPLDGNHGMDERSHR